MTRGQPHYLAEVHDWQDRRCLEAIERKQQDDGTCPVSWGYLARYAVLGYQSARASIERLTQAGRIELVRAGGGGAKPRPNLYRITDDGEEWLNAGPA